MDRCKGGEAGISAPPLRRGRNAPPRAIKRNSRSYQPFGGFGETPSPSAISGRYSEAPGGVNDHLANAAGRHPAGIAEECSNSESGHVSSR